MCARKRVYHVCKVWIDKYVPPVTVWHHSASLVMPKRPLGQIYLSISDTHERLLSRLMGKPTTCLCENKGAYLLCGSREADQRLCFRYTDSTIPLLSKSRISSLYPSSVTVQPDLCWTWSETTLLVFPQGGSFDVYLNLQHMSNIARKRIYGLSNLTQICFTVQSQKEARSFKFQS